jgi:hypothetical protein
MKTLKFKWSQQLDDENIAFRCTFYLKTRYLKESCPRKIYDQVEEIINTKETLKQKVIQRKEKKNGWSKRQLKWVVGNQDHLLTKRKPLRRFRCKTLQFDKKILAMKIQHKQSQRSKEFRQSKHQHQSSQNPKAEPKKKSRSMDKKIPALVFAKF